VNDGIEPPTPEGNEAEIAVLGSIILLPDALDSVSKIIRSDDFFDDANRTIFEAITELHATARKIDPTLLRENIRSKGKYQAIGGAAYFAKVITSVNNAAHAEYFAQIVKNKSTLRKRKRD